MTARAARRPPRHTAHLNRFLAIALLRLYPPAALVIGAPADECLRLLIASTRPSTRKLHLRDLFADGRRYYIQPNPDGFRLTSDNTPMWARRGQRSTVTAYLIGTFARLETDANITLVRMRARMYRLAWLRALLLPTVFAGIVLYFPWSAALETAAIVLFYATSLVAARLNAAIQVNEMMYFVHKVFADLPPVVPRELPERHADVVYGSGDFAAEWQRFYESRQDDDRAPG
jgi:hypothetical protein